MGGLYDEAHSETAKATHWLAHAARLDWNFDIAKHRQRRRTVEPHRGGTVFAQDLLPRVGQTLTEPWKVLFQHDTDLSAPLDLPTAMQLACQGQLRLVQAWQFRALTQIDLPGDAEAIVAPTRSPAETAVAK